MDNPSPAEVVVCGAGIAGVSTAYHLVVRLGMSNVVLIDPLPPLSLTSDKSTECYRNWWPVPSMVALVNRSVDLLDEWATESGNAFHLNRRGYLYVTGDPDTASRWETSGREISAAGAGPLRIHRGGASDPRYHPSEPAGFDRSLDGADLIVDRSLIRRHFPYLTETTRAALHARRAGWFAAQQLGTYLLEQARRGGLRTLRRRVVGVEAPAGRVQAVRLDDGALLAAGAFVNAAGPLLPEVGRMVGENLPVSSELHLKVAFREHRGLIPREAPMLIWSDPQRLDWTPEERAMLDEEPGGSLLAGELPSGCHGRPEGGAGSPYVLALWEYRRTVMEPTWPLPRDPLYPEVVLRGMSKMIPGLRAYRDRLPQASVDGGYYSKTVENLPLVGPLRRQGAFVVGALSGFGVMAAPAAGELAALHVAGRPLPAVASAFDPRRYEDPAYVAGIEQQAETGQL